MPPLTQGGWVYTWGSGRVGQLGQGTKQVAEAPGLVEDLVENNVLVKEISCGMYHNAALTVENDVYTWGSNVEGCLGRPEELEHAQESYTAVPGMVEGLTGVNRGPALSVACGREFTVIALGPYLGPTEEELIEMDNQEFERQEAVSREQERVDEARAEQVEQIREDKRRELLKILNDQFPQCASCPLTPAGEEPFCMGFTPDGFAPTICVHCKHSRVKHSRKHESTKDLEVVQQNARALGVDPELIELELPPEDPY